MHKISGKTFLLISFLGIFCSCKVKNPMVGQEKDKEKAVEEDGAVTANVISIFRYGQVPYNNSEVAQNLDKALSSFRGQTFVATEDSSYANQATPPLGCRSISELPRANLQVARFLDIGTLSLRGPGYDKSFSSHNEDDVPFVFSEHEVMSPGNYTMNSEGNNGILQFSQDFSVVPRSEEISIEIDDGQRIRQGLDFPDYNPEPEIKIASREFPLIIYANTPQNISVVRIYIGDAGVLSHVCHFAPAASYTIPANIMAALGPMNKDSVQGLIFLDFVNFQFHQDTHGYVRQLYVESFTRHIHGYLASADFYLGALGLLGNAGE